MKIKKRYKRIIEKWLEGIEYEQHNEGYYIGFKLSGKNYGILYSIRGKNLNYYIMNERLDWLEIYELGQILGNSIKRYLNREEIKTTTKSYLTII